MGKQFPKKSGDDFLDDLQDNTGHVNDRLAAFSAKGDDMLKEGTSTYFKFRVPGDKLDALFEGIEERSLDADKPEKLSECAIVVGGNGERYIMAQTIIVKELRKKWDELKETGFPVRIIYKGKLGEAPNEYQSFRLLFE